MPTAERYKTSTFPLALHTKGYMYSYVGDCQERMPTGIAVGVPLLVPLLAACCLTAWSLEHFGFFTFYFLFAASARSSIGSASFVNFLYVTMFAFYLYVYLLSCLLSAIMPGNFYCLCMCSTQPIYAIHVHVGYCAAYCIIMYHVAS